MSFLVFMGDQGRNPSWNSDGTGNWSRRKRGRMDTVRDKTTQTLGHVSGGGALTTREEGTYLRLLGPETWMSFGGLVSTVPSRHRRLPSPRPHLSNKKYRSPKKSKEKNFLWLRRIFYVIETYGRSFVGRNLFSWIGPDLICRRVGPLTC